MHDLPFLSILHAKLDEVSGEVRVIIGHEKYKIPLFSVEMVFIDKRDGQWISQYDFFVPDYVTIEANTLVKRRLIYYLEDIFGTIFDEYLFISDPVIELGENAERELAYTAF